LAIVSISIENETADRRILLFASLTAVAAPVAYCAFLETLSYLARSWYFLAWSLASPSRSIVSRAS